MHFDLPFFLYVFVCVFVLGMANLSAMDLLLFHKLELDFFQRLVRELGQEPERMRWVMALWLWFEYSGHHDFIRRVAAFRGPVVLCFVTEAFVCLNRLAGFPTADDGLPYTNVLLTEPMDHLYFECHRKEAVDGVTSFYKNVCRVVFNDAEEVRMPSNVRAMLLGGARIGPSGEGTSRMLSLVPLPAGLNPMASPWRPARNPSPEDHRSMFITFSRGYPISKDDIIEFFYSRYGPCVESVMIERAPAGQLPVYGRLVLTSASMIPVVLNGQQTAKFMIKGRHLWARIYVPNSRHDL